jgi:DNA repair protein RadC
MVVTQYCTRRNSKTNHPFLKEIKKFDWEKDFLSYDNIVEFLNKKLDMNVLTQEFAYVIAFNYHNIPVGLYELSHGMADECNMNTRDLGIFLLLSGANRFIVAHNHPNGIAEPSVADVIVTGNLHKLANVLDIELIQHFVIGNDGYDCTIYEEDDDEDDEEDMPFSCMISYQDLA